MPRPRKVYVRSVAVELHAADKVAAEEAARADDRSVTSWVARACRRLLASGAADSFPDTRLVDVGPDGVARLAGGFDSRLYLDMPGDVVDAIEDRGRLIPGLPRGARWGISEFIRRAIRLSAREPARA